VGLELEGFDLMTKKFFAGALSVLLAVSTASAAVNVAQLSQTQGKVLVNHGSGFQPANGLVSLNVGDKIMIGKEGSAALSYGGADCTVSLAPSSVTTVTEMAPCKAGETVAAIDSVIVTPAKGKGGGYGGGGAQYVPIVVSLSFIVTILVTIWGIKHNHPHQVSRP
jgi:hypothetical protein